MQMNERGMALLRQFEGCKLTAYLCPAGVATIGFGVTGPTIKLGMTITQAQADDMLAKALAPRGDALDLMLGTVETTPDEFSAMLCLLYNIGADNFRRSTVLARHLLGNHLGASKAFSLWNKARVQGVMTILPGLTRRRAAEAKLYLGEPA